MSVRQASHAGSWYSKSPSKLSSELSGWLNDVTPPVKGIGEISQANTPPSQLPVPGARIIIAPHAGYAYSGPAAAWAYKSWDITKAKRIFVLGPSHHFYLTNAALSKCTEYATPLGNLQIDRSTTDTLYKTGQFAWMSQSVDEEEHSLEMHLPYVHHMLRSTFGKDSSLPPIVPIMVGNTSPATEASLGKLLAPYLVDPANSFVVSSDFAHWGLRFRYTYYLDESGQATDLESHDRAPKQPAIHDSIKKVDFQCIDACETGKHKEWLDVLQETGNTVCGRHPIGVVMAGIEAALSSQGSTQQGDGRLKFVRYERSSLVQRVADSSVSYASAYAVL